MVWGDSGLTIGIVAAAVVVWYAVSAVAIRWYPRNEFTDQDRMFAWVISPLLALIVVVTVPFLLVYLFLNPPRK